MGVKIFKYPLEIVCSQFIELPEDAEILCVQNQNEVPCLWVRVVEGNKPYMQRICMHGTGEPDAHHGKHYIGTVQLRGGSLVLHVFR